MVWSVHATPQYRKFSQPLPGQFFPISTLNIIPLNHSITSKLPHGNADDDRYDGSTPLSCKTLKLLSGLFFLFSLSSSLLRSSVVRSSYSVEGGVVVVVVALALPGPVLLPSTSLLPPFPPFLLPSPFPDSSHNHKHSCLLPDSFSSTSPFAVLESQDAPGSPRAY